MYRLRVRPSLLGTVINPILMFEIGNSSAPHRRHQSYYPFDSNSYYSLRDNACSASAVESYVFLLDTCVPFYGKYMKSTASGLNPKFYLSFLPCLDAMVIDNCIAMVFQKLFKRCLCSVFISSQGRQSIVQFTIILNALGTPLKNLQIRMDSAVKSTE
jgi:hypothetical protein